jgi:asparagine synthetase B (glutamine-hydrolysing)
MKPVYYNPLGLYSDFSGQLDIYHQIQGLFNPAISIYDRTGTIECPVDIVNQYPIPVGTARDFETICRERIETVLEHTGEIGVLFSGGIDSTLVTSLLLEHISAEHRERITFFYNEASIVENQPFFDRFIRGKFKTGSSWNFDSWLREDRIALTGECADNLFGSLSLKFLMQRLDDPRLIHKSYESYIPKLWGSKLGDNFALIYDKFQELASKSPTPIKSMHDWFWWLNFTMKWQAVVYRIYSHTDLTLSKNRVVHFFNTDEFQLWSLQNPDLKVRDTWYSYKWLMKDLIYKFDGDENYRQYKVKFPSLPSMVRFREVVDYISDDFTPMSKDDLKPYVRL